MNEKYMQKIRDMHTSMSFALSCPPDLCEKLTLEKKREILHRDWVEEKKRKSDPEYKKQLMAQLLQDTRDYYHRNKKSIQETGNYWDG